jgi:hypothetical protein
MTAKNPGFTPEQRAITVRSLRDLKLHLESRAGLEVFWRISPKVVDELGVKNQYEQAASQELTEVLKQVDAVITTPSTAILEAMLVERPVAALDYHNVPRFVPTAWTISAPYHIRSAIDEILNPATRKMAFQKDCLHDCLCCEGPAAQRANCLISKMAGMASDSAHECLPLNFPANMLSFTSDHTQSKRPTLQELYPEQQVFSDNSLESLQGKVARLQNENLRLKRQLDSRNVSYLFLSKLRQWSRRVGALHQ